MSLNVGIDLSQAQCLFLSEQSSFLPSGIENRAGVSLNNCHHFSYMSYEIEANLGQHKTVGTWMTRFSH